MFAAIALSKSKDRVSKTTKKSLQTQFLTSSSVWARISARNHAINPPDFHFALSIWRLQNRLCQFNLSILFIFEQTSILFQGGFEYAFNDHTDAEGKKASNTLKNVLTICHDFLVLRRDRLGFTGGTSMLSSEYDMQFTKLDEDNFRNGIPMIRSEPFDAYGWFHIF